MFSFLLNLALFHFELFCGIPESKTRRNTKMNLSSIYNGSFEDRLRREYLLDKLFRLKAQVVELPTTRNYDYIFHAGTFLPNNTRSEELMKSRNSELEAEISEIMTELQKFSN